MKVIFLFPGYGSQYVGMGKEIYNSYRVVQEYFEEASSCLNINFVKLCFASSDVDMSKISNAYPALFLVSTAIFALLKELGLVPTELAGYNQGEFAALFAGGSFTLPDGLYLLSKYSQFYETKLNDMDVEVIKVTGVSAGTIEQICLGVNQQSDRKAFVAIYQSPSVHIISGDTLAVQSVKNLVHAQTDGSVNDVSPYLGLHSPLMNPILEKFKIYLEKVDFKDLTIPLIEGANASRIQKNVAIKELVVKNIHAPINWTKVMKQLADFDLIVEIGPGTQLSDLAKKEYPDKQILAINTKADIEALQAILKRQPEDVSDEASYSAKATKDMLAKSEAAGEDRVEKKAEIELESSIQEKKPEQEVEKKEINKDDVENS